MRKRQALAAAAAAAAAEQHESSSSSGDDDDNENDGSKKNNKRRRTRRRPFGYEGSGYGDSVPSSLGALGPWIEVERAWQEIEGRTATATTTTMTPLDPRLVPWPPSFDHSSRSSDDSLPLLAHVAAAARCSLASAWRRTARRYHPDKLGVRLRATARPLSGGSGTGSGSGGGGSRNGGSGSDESASASTAAVVAALARGAAVVAAAAAEWELASRKA